MVPRFRRALQLLVVLGPALAVGCFGKSHNPSYFPYFLRPGDVIPTHAKPPGRGYYANYDPYAIRLEVRPQETTSSVRSHQVLLATVYDAQGKPRRNRRLEWMLEGVGNLIEVDESGFHPGRGYKLDNRYAISYTNYLEHRMTRGNNNPLDDFQLRPGQSWCVVSSAAEGDTYVTVYAPEIYNWENNKVTVNIRWVDAGWMLPQPVAARAGSEQALTTTVLRTTDKRPLANYLVRYRVLDGPPAYFAETRGPEATATSDLNGHATVRLVQATTQQGANRIGIEIIRPPDPTSPSGAGVPIGRGEVVQSWLGPSIALNLTGPAVVLVGQEVTYTTTVTNPGQIETQAQTVRLPIPDGLRYLRSQPSAALDDNQLTWTLGTLAGGQMHTVNATFAATRSGPVQATATVATFEGLRDQRTVATQVAAPQLKLTMTGPAEGFLGTPFAYQLTVTNPGDGPLSRVILTAELSAALEHEKKSRKIELELGTVPAGQSRSVALPLTPRQVGALSTKVTATADGNLRDNAEKIIQVRQAQMSLNLSGPKVRYVDRPAEWTVQAVNTGQVPLTDVVLRTALPAELAFVQATDNGQWIQNAVVWNLGTLQPKETREVKVTTHPLRLAAKAIPIATATAAPGVQTEARAELEIRGIPALAAQVEKTGDPVAVGGRITYQVIVTNTGSLPGNGITLEANLPPELRLVNAAGPTHAQPTIAPHKVSFSGVSGLAPKQSLRYVFEAQALKPGDVRISLKVNSDALASRGAVTKEESTRVYPLSTSAIALEGSLAQWP